MAQNNKLVEEIADALKSGAPIITAADIKNGVVERIQLYFDADGEAVMDVISKDDLVQNFPDEGIFVLAQNSMKCSLRKLVMFEGEEDMYFRTDGTRTEEDEFGGVPNVLFMETVEAMGALKL